MQYVEDNPGFHVILAMIKLILDAEWSIYSISKHLFITSLQQQLNNIQLLFTCQGKYFTVLIVFHILKFHISFKSLVRFLFIYIYLRYISCAHQGSIYLIKIQPRRNIVKYFYNLKYLNFQHHYASLQSHDPSEIILIC